MTGRTGRGTSTWRRRSCGVLVAAAALVAVNVLTADATPGPRVAAASAQPRPTVVLVHGAWADSSSWNGVVRRLVADGYPVRVFPTPLRSLAGDAAALRAYLSVIRGPIVLVGHSYGGAVVTDAATGLAAVSALVYVDAFAPAEGERVFDLPGPDSALAVSDPATIFTIVPDPVESTVDLYLRTQVFQTAVAKDVPRDRSRILAATQRPITLSALMEESGAPAWTSIPSWFEVGTVDKILPPEVQMSMARRAGGHIVRVRSGHLPMVSTAAAVTATIEQAACATD